MTGSNVTGKPSAVMRAEQQAIADAQPVTVTCLWCPDWRFHGPAGEARAHALEHRVSQHPGLKRPRTQRSTLRRFRNPNDSWWREQGEQAAREVAAMLARREQEEAAA